MYDIKDLCKWYNRHPQTIKKRLVEEGIVPPGGGKGRRKPLSLTQLMPIFRKYGRPLGISLTLDF